MLKRQMPGLMAGFVTLGLVAALAMPACDREPEVSEINEPAIAPFPPGDVAITPAPQPVPGAAAPGPVTPPGDTADSTTPQGELRVGGEMPEPDEVQPEIGGEPTGGTI